MGKFDDRLQKESREHPIRKWWNSNSYKVFRIILFPIWLFILARDCHEAHLKEKAIFSKERAKALLDKYLPKIFANELKYEPEGVLLRDTGYFGYQLRFRTDLKIPRRKQKDIVFRDKFFPQILEYLWNEYEIDGWTVVRLQNWMDWDRAEREYGWETCWSKDYAKGVYFKREQTHNETY